MHSFNFKPDKRKPNLSNGKQGRRKLKVKQVKII